MRILSSSVEVRAVTEGRTRAERVEREQAIHTVETTEGVFEFDHEPTLAEIYESLDEDRLIAALVEVGERLNALAPALALGVQGSLITQGEADRISAGVRSEITPIFAAWKAKQDRSEIR
jgi:hypothetical protein